MSYAMGGLGYAAMSLLLSPIIYVPPTPASLTADALRYDCRLVDETFKPVVLGFYTEGGRGYWASAGEARRTPVSYVFTEDGTSTLKSMQMVPEQETFQAADPFETTPRTARFRSDEAFAVLAEVTPHGRTLASGGWKASLVVTVDHVTDVTRYAGFCDVRTQSQDPLTEKETRKLKSK